MEAWYYYYYYYYHYYYYLHRMADIGIWASGDDFLLAILLLDAMVLRG